MTSGLTILRTPREAAGIYGLSGAHAPRQHHMFAVCFRKAGTTSTAGSTSTGAWQNTLSFLVKTVDRPSVEPKVEELNQYNKKRLITTGYKIGPTRMTIYDTADSAAMQMWAEYSKYYFGDFRHATSETDWNSDVIQNTFNGADTGFGFAPQAASNTSDEFNAQFFFDSVSVYQVFGAKFVQYDLIRPRIVAFNPDELDYSNADAATIQISLQCEAIVYINDFQPQPISADAFLSEAFGNTFEFNGDVFDYPANDATDPTTLSYSVYTPSSFQVPVYAATTPAPVLRAADPGISSGTLSAYGSYNFGTTAAVSQAAPSLTLTSDLSQSAVANPLLSTSLALGSNLNSAFALPALSSPYVQSQSISQDVYDQAAAAVASAGLQGGTLPSGDLASAIVYGTLSAGAATGSTGREMVIARSPSSAPAAYATGNPSSVRSYDASERVPTFPIAAVNADGSITTAPPGSGVALNAWSSPSSQGFSLSPYAYGVVNAQRSSTAQIGVNTRNQTAYTNRFGSSGYTYPKSF